MDQIAEAGLAALGVQGFIGWLSGGRKWAFRTMLLPRIWSQSRLSPSFLKVAGMVTCPFPVHTLDPSSSANCLDLAHNVSILGPPRSRVQQCRSGRCPPPWPGQCFCSTESIGVRGQSKRSRDRGSRERKSARTYNQAEGPDLPSALTLRLAPRPTSIPQVVFAGLDRVWGTCKACPVSRRLGFRVVPPFRPALEFRPAPPVPPFRPALAFWRVSGFSVLRR